MTNRETQLAALRIVMQEIQSTVDRNSGTFGVPGGHLYAALMGVMSLEVFTQIMAAMVKHGRVIKRGECYFKANANA